MQGPYAFINERPQPYPLLKLSLSLNPYTQTKFDTLNQHIRNTVVLPGQLVIIGDSRTASCTAEEARLMRSAQNIKHDLLAHSATDDFLIKNYDQLQAILSHASLGVGSASSAWSKHLAQIEQTLMEIEQLHKEYMRKGSVGVRDEFLIKRRALFLRLDTQLSGMAHLGSGLKNEASIKKMLAISSKRYWHHGEIRGYEERVKRVARASQMLKKGTYIGIALDVGAAALEVTEACTTGREQECTRAHYVEGGKLVLGVGGAYTGGSIGATIGVGACAIVFGIPTGGVGALACAVVGGAVGALALGSAGSGLGEVGGTFIYKTWKELMALLYIGLFSSVLMLLSIPLTFFVMFKKLDAAESYVEHTDYFIGHRKALRFAPFEGRASRVIAMAIIILIPNVLQWRRLVRVEDVRKIPPHLKFWMVFPTLVALMSIIGMGVSWLFLDPNLL